MNVINMLVILMFIAVLLVGFAQKMRISYPIALVFGGALLGFIPGLKVIDFDPKTLLIVILPPILFYASYSLSLNEFFRYINDIISLAIGLVIITTFVHEVLRARKQLAIVATNEIQQLHSSKYLDDEEKDLLTMYFDSHHKIKEISSISEDHKIEQTRHSIVQKQRERLMKMWKNNEINDDLMSELEREFDLEESHLVRGEIN